MNEKPEKPFRSGSGYRMAIRAKQEDRIVTTHYVSGDFFKDQQRIEAGKGAKLKVARKAKKEKKPTSDDRLSLKEQPQTMSKPEKPKDPPSLDEKSPMIVKPVKKAIDKKKTAKEVQKSKVTPKGGKKPMGAVSRTPQTASDLAKSKAKPKLFTKVATTSEIEYPSYEPTEPYNYTDFEYSEMDSEEFALEEEISQDRTLYSRSVSLLYPSYEEDIELERETDLRDLDYETISSLSDIVDGMSNVPHFSEMRVPGKAKNEGLPDFDIRLPDIDEISLDPSILYFADDDKKRVTQAKKEEVKKEEVKKEEEVKKVVIVIEKSAATEEEEGEEAEGEEERTSSEETSTEMSSFSYEFRSTSEDEKPIIKRVEYQETFEDILEKEADKTLKIEDTDIEILARIGERRQLEKDVKGFVQSLIECVMEESDYVDPDDWLREQLDKVELFRQFADILVDKLIEDRVSKFLMRKMGDYNRHQKSENNEATLSRDQETYMETLDQLSQLLEKEVEAEKIITEKEDAAQEELTVMENSYKAEVDGLNELILRTVTRNGTTSNHFTNFVQSQIKEMAELRKRISSTRSVFIGAQHTSEELKERKIALEYVGPNLNSSHFQRLKDEIAQVVMELDEKNTYLDRLRKRYNTHTNVLAHLRQDKISWFGAMKHQLAELEWLMAEKRSLQQHIHRLKRKRIPILKRIYDMNFEFGLINKPALLIDYDEVCDQIVERKGVVQGLRNQILSLQKRFDSKCSTMIAH